jgi:hypothetical protein
VHAGGEGVDLRGGEKGVDGVEAGDVAVKIVSISPIGFAN